MHMKAAKPGIRKTALEVKPKKYETGATKLEIGSGAKPKEGCLHFDVRPLKGIDVVGDAKKLPFENEQFKEIYSRFFLEHLPRKDALIVLKEMFRVLLPKGSIEIIVPNLEYFCRLFVEEKGQKKEWALNKIYGFENYAKDHHYFGYDFEELKNALGKAGFVDVEQVKEKEEQYLHVKARRL